MDNGDTSGVTSSRSIICATFHLTGSGLSHPTDLPGELPVPLECHTLTLNMIELRHSHRHQHTAVALNSRICASMPTLWQTMLLTHKPLQPQYASHSTMKRKSMSFVMDGLQKKICYCQNYSRQKYLLLKQLNHYTVNGMTSEMIWLSLMILDQY